jgi:hypothetical protein
MLALYVIEESSELSSENESASKSIAPSAPSDMYWSLAEKDMLFGNCQ